MFEQVCVCVCVCVCVWVHVFVFTPPACTGTRCAIADRARDNSCQRERERTSESERKGERGRELAEGSEWKIHTAAGPKSPSVFARSPQLQTAGQGWRDCAREMGGTHKHTCVRSKWKIMARGGCYLGIRNRLKRESTARQQHRLTSTGCTGQHLNRILF